MPVDIPEAKEIGVVTGVQGIRWFEGTIVGQEAHTGATPMRLRKNALIGAARLVDRIDAIVERGRHVARFQCPDLPPDFSTSWISAIVTPFSMAFTMS